MNTFKNGEKALFENNNCVPELILAKMGSGRAVYLNNEIANSDSLIIIDFLKDYDLKEKLTFN